MYDHPNPIFLDFETQSACELKEEGSYRYAYHKTTRIFICVVCIDEHYHVWVPRYVGHDCTSWPTARMWPSELKPAYPLTFYSGNVCPSIITETAKTRPIVAHNAMNFDKLIWDRLIGFPVFGWIDSIYLSRASGLPGGLEALSKTKLGKGKDHAKRLLPVLTTARPDIFNADSAVYPKIPIGDLQAFTRYAIGDVELVRLLYPSFHDLEVEEDVIHTNDRINERGVRVDAPLLRKIESLAAYSVYTAGKEIERLTDGKLHEDNIRSVKQMHEWLESYGVSIVDDNGNKCLRKEIVQRWLDSPYVVEENIDAATEIPPLVCDVLRLRLKALRITDAKVKRAQQRVSSDGRVRGLHAYHAAHTGRWSSFGIQIHNLPRPIQGLNVETMLQLFADDSGNDPAQLYKTIASAIEGLESSPGRLVSVDDVCSTMVRPAFIPENDNTVFGICDYSKVEACCVAWMADEEELLDAFRKGLDVYKIMASKLYGVPIAEVTTIQRDVGKVVVLACGYSMGANKLRVYAANAGIDLVKANITAEECINVYRNTHQNIAGWQPDHTRSFRVGGLWKDLDTSVKECVETGVTTYAGKCSFSLVNGTLWARLPSGRVIRYPNARIEDVIPPYVYQLGLPEIPKATVVYDSPRGKKSLYGGLELENISQGHCRDLMANALVKMEREGLNPVLTVHDEIVSEFVRNKSEELLKRTVAIMSECPSWSEGFPVSCEGYLAPRFVKKPFKGWMKLETKDLSNARNI